MEVVTFLLIMGAVFGFGFAAAEHTRKRRNRLWSAAADALQLEFVPGTGFSGRPVLYGTLRGVPVNVNVRVYGSGKNQQTYTRVDAELPRDTPENLVISKEGFFSGVGKFFGGQDIQVGIPKVDDAFVIKANDEQDVAELMRHEGMLPPLVALCAQRGGIAGGQAWVEAYGFVEDQGKVGAMLDQVLDVVEATETALGHPSARALPDQRAPRLEPPPPPPVAEPEPVAEEDPLQKLTDRMLLRREREAILAQMTAPRVLTVEVLGTETPRDAEGLALVGKVGEVAVEVRYPIDRMDELEGVKKGDILAVMAHCTGWEDFRRRAVFAAH